MKKFASFLLFFISAAAIAVPLDLYSTYVTNYPSQSRKGQWIQLMARGTGTNDMYVMEVDPTTGALPVSGTFTSSFTPNVTDFGVTTNALRTASVIGNTTGQAAFGTGVRSAQTLRVTVATDDVIPASQSGTWNINNVSGTVSLPTGAATSALQGTGNTSLSSIDGKTPSLGQAAMAASVPVAIASNQSAIPVTQSGTWTVQPGNTANTTAWKVDGSAVTQPVSGSVTVSGTVAATQSGTWNINNVSGTVSLPTGASTEATLSTLNGKIANDYGSSATAVRSAAQVGNATGVADFNTGAAGAQTLRTVLAARSEAAATPLSTRLSNGTSFLDTDSGASSSTTLRTVLSTRQESVTTPLAAQLSNGSAAIDYGSGASGTATVRVVPSTRSEAAATPLSVRISDGSAFLDPTSAGGTYADSVRNDYSSTSVTTGAWVQLIASTAAIIKKITIFDSCGQTLELGTGAAAAETRKLIIPPGGIDGQMQLNIPAGTRVSVRAISATCSVGELDITGFN